MKRLRDDILVDCYVKSVEWQLEQDFIDILRQEMEKRNLKVPDCSSALAVPAAPGYSRLQSS
ncbi:sporulation histidine kinase inhibitor Sda [Paenibacillus sp. GCM10012303]|uniref:sporulation histidine kinase inhibitor Sda n=1 Tax=Paenibacillus sp. GCM10012303 TaxID=3317340 RepID=UPI003616C36E